MKSETFNEIMEVINSFPFSSIGPNRICDKILKEKFPDVSNNTLISIYSYEYTKKMKSNHPKAARMAEDLYCRYKIALKKRESPGIMLRMSDELVVSAALLAKLILEQHYKKISKDPESPMPKNFISRLLKDPTLIEDVDLSYEVYLCNLKDDQYGPISDCIKHSIGQEYELKLLRVAKQLGLSFRNEEQLRLYGFDKTPDLKLELPIAVDGFIVNWVESKALFGSQGAHKAYMKEQYLSYWNRFGPGMVIYWFGFVDALEETTENKIIIRDSFPENITQMNQPIIESNTD